MSDLAISIIFGISGLLCVAWVITTMIQSTKQRKSMERELYLKEIAKTAEENERDIKEAEEPEQSGEQSD